MFKEKIKSFLFVYSVFLLAPSVILASTHVYPEDIQENWTWDKAGSPYILEDSIYIPSGYKLNIEKGVEVHSATNTSSEPFNMSLNGDLSIRGTKDDPVKISNVYSLNLEHNNSHIEFLELDGLGLDISKGTSTMEFVTIRNSFTAITAKGSNIDISSSTLENNSYGIMSNFQKTMFLASLPSFMPHIKRHNSVENILSGVFSIPTDTDQNIIRINNSRIVNNSINGIINQTDNSIDARNNWWGKSIGPNAVDIVGDVYADPWLKSDPNIAVETKCCSNVIFIPGLEASRLYKDQRGLMGLGTSTNTLWEPNRNADVEKLYLDSDGRSIDKTIYTKDVLDKIPGIKKIYQSFIETMDALVKDGSINEWLPIPYDWRMDVNSVVDSTFVNRIIASAQTSKTGKVIIVAHSNGGLVTKQLMKKLEAAGKSNIVEKIINIAVPELGTPQAILAMLNGYDQGIMLGAILSENNARTLSQNMPGAYGLLPNESYFKKNTDSVISDSYSSNIGNGSMVKQYINRITSFDGLKEFVLNGPFSKLSTSNTKVPLKLNKELFSNANTIHRDIDNWMPASSTRVITILGSGLKTPSGIHYKKDPHCDPSNKKCDVEYSAEFKLNGDGTVLTKSKSENSSKTLFFDLKKHMEDLKTNISHANILESAAILGKISNTVKNIDSNEKDYDKYFSETEPVYDDKYLTVTVYSPVNVHVYDENGLHSGPTRETPLEEGQVLPRENNIPDVTYATFGDNTQVIVPYGNGSKYRIVMNGNDSGVFIVESNISVGDTVIATTTFSELPVFKETNMEFIVSDTPESFATGTILNIDVDGDDNIDVVGHTDRYLNSTSTELIKDPATFAEILYKAKASLKVNKKVEREMDNKLERVKKNLDKHGKNKIHRVNKKLVGKWFKKRKLLDREEVRKANEIQTQIDRLLETIERDGRN